MQQTEKEALKYTVKSVGGLPPSEGGMTSSH